MLAALCSRVSRIQGVMSGLVRLSLLALVLMALIGVARGVARAEEAEAMDLEDEGMDEPSPESSKEIIEAMDKDGKLTLDEMFTDSIEGDDSGEMAKDGEFKAELTRHFTKADADADGFLDESEVETFRGHKEL